MHHCVEPGFDLSSLSARRDWLRSNLNFNLLPLRLRLLAILFTLSLLAIAITISLTLTLTTRRTRGFKLSDLPILLLNDRLCFS